MLVLDETGFVKKGCRSVGVNRQYSGTAGRIENCQIGVFPGYAARHGRVLINWALHLPEDWAGDEERRRVAGVPENVAFVTKPKLGRAMLKRAVADGVPCAWVAADSVYGGDYALRAMAGAPAARLCRRYDKPTTRAEGFRHCQAAGGGTVQAGDSTRLSAGNGAKGPCVSMRERWCPGLLVRRSVREPDKLTH